MLALWGMQVTHILPSPPGPLSHEEVAYNKELSMVYIELIDI